MKPCTQRERKPSEAFVKRYAKRSQRHPALNLEHRNLLISILVGNLLPDIKKQTADNIVGWVDQPMMSFKLQPNSLRNWEQPSLSYTFLHNWKCSYGGSSKSTEVLLRGACIISPCLWDANVNSYLVHLFKVPTSGR